MHRVFKRLPLPVKLLLLGFIPLALFIAVFFQLYQEKNQKVALMQSHIDRIHQSTNINTLISSLQRERKYSFDYSMRRVWPADLTTQRSTTDKAILQMDRGILKGFSSYTFLDSLQEIRKLVDSSQMAPENVMQYYTTAIYRINSLNVVSPGSDMYLQPVYQDLVAQKLLSEMITNLGVMRSVIYNVLYTNKDKAQTLEPIARLYAINETYEKEFILKASPDIIRQYNELKAHTMLAPTLGYMNTLFRKYSFDSAYDAATWWRISDSGVSQLKHLQLSISDNVNIAANALLEKEKIDRNRALIFLLIVSVVVVCVIIYTISSITSTLNKMKWAAQAIAKGAPAPFMQIESKDAIGSLAESISLIDVNNKTLADAANEIGNGHFDVPVSPRSEEDILGNAIVRMKENLLGYDQLSRENTEVVSKLAEKYKTIFYKSPLPKWIYDYETLRFLEVNDAAVKHYGYSQEEFMTMNIRDIRPEEDVEKLYEDIENGKAGLPAAEQHWRHIKKDGEFITVEVVSHFIDYNGRMARMIVINDVTEKLKAEQALQQSHSQLRELASHLQNIREDERAAMAREVHDVLGQQVTCIKMDVAWLSKQLHNTSDEKTRNKMKELTELLDETALVVRRMASQLRPSILDDFGLAESLEWQCQDFEKRSEIKVEFKSAVPANISISKNSTTALFRICQESLTNIARHAAATLIIVSLSVTNGEIILTIQDNGKGFNVKKSEEKNTLGLVGMKERSIMIGGSFEIKSEPTKGSVIVVKAPL
jgi:PAS domain S-box-containing protein